MRLAVYRFLTCLFLLSALSGGPALAAEPATSFNIPAGPAETTLKNYGAQAGQEVLFATATVSGVLAAAVGIAPVTD